jgi:hypothetical protein
VREVMAKQERAGRMEVVRIAGKNENGQVGSDSQLADSV